MRTWTSALLLALCACPAAQAPDLDALTITEARVRAPPPGTPNTAAFMTLANAGDAPLVLVDAQASVSAAVELHDHIADERGVVRMRRIPRIEVPAGGRVALRPGGLHVMFIGLGEPLEAGDQIALTLRFQGGGTRTLDVPVETIAPMDHRSASHPASAPAERPASAPGRSTAESAPSSQPAR